jgi:hypothetical protein
LSAIFTYDRPTTARDSMGRFFLARVAGMSGEGAIESLHVDVPGGNRRRATAGG